MSIGIVTIKIDKSNCRVCGSDGLMPEPKPDPNCTRCGGEKRIPCVDPEYFGDNKVHYLTCVCVMRPRVLIYCGEHGGNECPRCTCDKRFGRSK